MGPRRARRRSSTRARSCPRSRTRSRSARMARSPGPADETNGAERALTDSRHTRTRRHGAACSARWQGDGAERRRTCTGPECPWNKFGSAAARPVAESGMMVKGPPPPWEACTQGLRAGARCGTAAAQLSWRAALSGACGSGRGARGAYLPRDRDVVVVAVDAVAVWGRRRCIAGILIAPAGARGSRTPLSRRRVLPGCSPARRLATREGGLRPFLWRRAAVHMPKLRDSDGRHLVHGFASRRRLAWS